MEVSRRLEHELAGPSINVGLSSGGFRFWHVLALGMQGPLERSPVCVVCLSLSLLTVNTCQLPDDKLWFAQLRLSWASYPVQTCAWNPSAVLSWTVTQGICVGRGQEEKARDPILFAELPKRLNSDP